MKILITGGAGFIGSHLCEALAYQDNQVTILDNFSTGSKENIIEFEDKIKLVNGDIRQVDVVESLVASADVIYHLAAAVGVKNILEHTFESISVNIAGSEVVLSAAAKYGKRIIIASTSEIYGKNPKQPLSETDDRLIGPPQYSRWSYSDSKAIEEYLAFAFKKSRNLQFMTVRFFNIVGPRQLGRYGMVMPSLIKFAKNNLPIEVYGDGSQTRVFCHVYDAVEALIKISENESAVGEVFNLGGIDEISIYSLAEKIKSLTNSKSPIIFRDYYDVYGEGYEDMERRVPDISKIKSYIDWQPTRNIEKIILDVAQSTI